MIDQKAPLDIMRDLQKPEEDFSRWRLRIATYIASQTDPERLGVEGFYLIGSTKNATAGPASDIDLLLHVRGTERQQKALEAWLEEWSVYLDEINYRKTGHRSGGLLDVHIVTDEDIAQQTSFAVKIGAVTDAARQLPMKKTL
jgi:pyruvate,water dikinase